MRPKAPLPSAVIMIPAAGGPIKMMVFSSDLRSCFPELRKEVIGVSPTETLKDKSVSPVFSSPRLMIDPLQSYKTKSSQVWWYSL
jgi:hypothetical protein